MIDNAVQSDLARLWESEYGRAGIPSSFRPEPSGSVTASLDILGVAGFRGTTAVDIGCGTGRNSMYLAELGYTVHAMDIAAAVVSRFQSVIAQTQLAGRVHATCTSVADPWPIESGVCDLAIDAFCFKHIISPEEQAAYLRELERVLAPGAYYVLTLAGKDDGYYGALPDESSDPARRVIVDPANRIASVLYDPSEVVGMLAPSFDEFFYEHKLKSGIMHGAEYMRSTHWFIMRRR